MTKFFHILSQQWIPIHIVTPAASVQWLPSATLCQDVSQDSLENFRDGFNRQQQVEHDSVGCWSLCVISLQHWIERLTWGEKTKEQGSSPGKKDVVGLESHKTQFCFTH